MNPDLEQRAKWPSELRYLLERYPRTGWPAGPSGEAQFWLEIHDHFRRDCVGLETAAEAYRQGNASAHELVVIVTPRLQTLVTNLHGHHSTEDHHYFPVFREIEPRLKPGFDVLEQDHDELQRDIATTLVALREFRASLGEHNAADRSAAAFAAEHYMSVSARLCRKLCRHLSDEEDLVVPLLLTHGS